MESKCWLWTPWSANKSEHCPKLFSSNPNSRNRPGGARSAWPAAAHAVALGLVRCEFPHVFRVPLFSPLVQSVERKVVWRLFADLLPTSDPPVDRPALKRSWVENGIHAGATDRGTVAAG